MVTFISSDAAATILIFVEVSSMAAATEFIFLLITVEDSETLPAMTEVLLALVCICSERPASPPEANRVLPNFFSHQL